MKELYDGIDIANKFAVESSSPKVSHEEQMETGLGWAARQAQRPEPEPITALKPIVPVAS